MKSLIHLYPESNEQQRLRLSYSLQDLHFEPDFNNVVEQFDISLLEVPAGEQLVPSSWQELTVRPPIPREKVEAFGRALIGIAVKSGRRSPGSIGFIDHTVKALITGAEA